MLLLVIGVTEIPDCIVPKAATNQLLFPFSVAVATSRIVRQSAKFLIRALSHALMHSLVVPQWCSSYVLHVALVPAVGRRLYPQDGPTARN